jgi:YesN/AraC family two-component response regulator
VGDVSVLKEYGVRNDLIALCKGMVLDVFSKQFNIQGGIPVDEDRISFLLNIKNEKMDNELKECLICACKGVNTALADKVDFSVSFSFGITVNSIQDIYYSLLQAKRRQGLRLITHSEDIIFCTDKETVANFPVIIQKKIINGIRLGNIEITEAAVGELFNSYILKKNYTHSEVQQLVILVVSSVVNYFCQEDEDMQLYNTDILGWIYENDSTNDFYDAMCRYFRSLIELKCEKTQQNNENNYISKVILFIKQNYHTDFSINNMADSIGLNAAYLSRIFKTATGKTIIEYITLFRLEKAKEMMQAGDMAIKDISAAVGYNEVRSFTRFFKKYEGVTPGEYRDARGR